MLQNQQNQLLYQTFTHYWTIVQQLARIFTSLLPASDQINNGITINLQFLQMFNFPLAHGS